MRGQASTLNQEWRQTDNRVVTLIILSERDWGCISFAFYFFFINNFTFPITLGQYDYHSERCYSLNFVIDVVIQWATRQNRQFQLSRWLLFTTAVGNGVICLPPRSQPHWVGPPLRAQFKPNVSQILSCLYIILFSRVARGYEDVVIFSINSSDIFVQFYVYTFRSCPFIYCWMQSASKISQISKLST